MSKIEDLEKILDRLGLTDYEKKIYLALLVNGPLNASEVGDITNIPKYNVYPTLKRLVLKKFVDDQPTARASKYKAIPPLIVVEQLQENLKKRHEKEQMDLNEIATLLSKFNIKEEDLVGKSPSDSVWLLNSEARIKKGILELLNKAKNSIIACIPTIETPTYLKTRDEVLQRLVKLMKKRKGKLNLILNWELQEGTADEAVANSIVHNGGSIYQWALGELPFSAFLIDNSEGLIVLQNAWSPIPKFGLALWIRHPAYVKPFEKLIERFNEAGAFKKWV
ncbi:MAG: TrmB family transcriptional regulator [Candidatus Helarchaeota archaeon]